MKWYVGTSGWGYDAWKGAFYPEDLPSREWLAFYARHFRAVEINTTFYHLTSARQIGSWEKSVPHDFTFAVKGSRYITHLKRLKDPKEGLRRFLKPLAARKKKGPLIFQLPPRMPKDIERLAAFLKLLPPRQRVAMEFRDPSWHDDEVYRLLRKHRVAFCLFEKAALRSPRLVTAGFIYVRLHGRKEGYKGNYSPKALKDWHGWLSDQGKDVYIFFDNTDQKLYAVENAQSFKALTEG